ERAAALLAVVDSRSHSAQITLEPCDRAEFDDLVQLVNTALGPARFAAAWASGQRMPLHQAARLALAEGEEKQP
ncbi:MAG: hypothetical protein MUD01_19165, partial [Chloroflexaceae bacterium]|nr:hypothetical protein [Chloroflexaceae bacterium]